MPVAECQAWWQSPLPYCCPVFDAHVCTPQLIFVLSGEALDFGLLPLRFWSSSTRVALGGLLSIRRVLLFLAPSYLSISEELTIGVGGCNQRDKCGLTARCRLPCSPHPPLSVPLSEHRQQDPAVRVPALDELRRNRGPSQGA